MNSVSIVRCSALFLLIGGALFGAASADPALDKLLAEGKYKEAIDYADEKIPTAQRDANLWVQLAQANDGLGMPEKALACYLVAWRQSADNYQVLLGAARMYNKLNQPDNAAPMAKKALEKNFSAEASWEYAKSCIALNRVVEAKSALEKVIQSDPTNQIANRELGNIYFSESAWQKALPLLKKTWNLKPDGELSFKIGKCCVNTGEADTAIVYLKDAVSRGVSQSEATLGLARIYYGQSNFAAAAASYQKLSGEGMNAMDFYRTASALEKVNNPRTALENYEKAVSQFGPDKSREALLSREKIGRAQLERKTYNIALGHFEFIADADPKAAIVPDIYYLLADAYAGTENGPRAIASLEKAIALNKNSIEAYARLADLYAKNGMPDKAKQTFEAMISLSPNDPNIYLTLGQYNLKAKKYGDAFDQFNRSNALKKSAAASEGMAVTAFNLSRFDAAVDAAETAVSLDPNLWDSHVILAKQMQQQKRYKEAIPHLEFMARRESGNVEYKEQLAACYAQTDEKAKLLDLDKQIVVLNLKNAESRLRLARDADARKDDDAAFQYYRELFTLQPKNSEVLRRLYELSLKKSNLYDAAMYLGHFVELSPTAEANRDYGDVLYQLKDYDRALAAYRAALKLNPAIKGFHKRYAEIVSAKGQQDEVITALSGVVQAGEADFGTYQTLGLIYQKKGNYQKAIDSYQKALQLDPKSSEALAALASCQASAGALNDAVISYEQVVMMDTGATQSFRELGDVYYKQGNTAAAVKNYLHYFARNPTDQEISKRLGKYSFETQDFPNVVKYLAMMQYRREEDIDFGLMYASACAATKQYKDAIRVLETLRALKPKGAAQRNVLKSLAEAYEKDGQDARAAECYGAYGSIPGAADPDVAYKHAFLFEKTSPGAAERVYENNIKQFPNDYRNFLRLGLLLSSNQAALSRAAAYLKRTTVLAESVPAVWLELAKVYNRMNDPLNELESYRNFIKSDPQNPEANKRMGVLLIAKGQVSEAMIYLELANTILPNDPDVMAALAKGYAATNRKGEAIELLKKCKAVRPNDLEIRSQLCDLYQKTGQNDKAKDEMKDLAGMKRGDTKLLLQYADACLAAGDLTAAASTVEDILATESGNIGVLMLKARIQTMEKKYDEAVETYKEISYINQNHAPSLTGRANIYFLQSKPQWAETFYQRAIKADPKYAPAELGMARICKLRRDTTGFQQHIDKAKILDPFDQEIQDEAKKAGR